MILTRVSSKTSFDSKQLKLEPKLVSALSETKRLFRLFRFYTETESFDVSIEPKQTKDQLKQFDRKHILQFFTENFLFFRFFVFLFFSRFFRFVLKSLFRCFGCFASIPKQRLSIDPKQTKDPPKQFKREYIWVFFRKFRVVSVCFGLFRFVTKQFCLFRYRLETPKQTETFCFWFHETNRNKRETDLVSVCFGSSRKLFLFVSRTP
jgi:hypothetical protein